ncbi:MAG: Gfo/Idh/MocA family oxidoreductase [Planctomycetes bacterium]|nr:Gfo/Idh/MocA family oxidoreductase [Planctomycetota bacterium]
MSDKLQWGIIGTGTIASELADAIAESTTGEVLAVGSRGSKTADDFAEEYEIPRRYEGYEKLLGDDDVEAVYVALPHPFHAEWTMAAARAGKHILVEKPIGMNQAEAQLMFDAARENDVFLMEAFMYRCHPQTKRIREIVADGVLGRVQLIRAAFSFRSGGDPKSRTLNPELGGGGILDVGCYPVSGSRLVAGAAAGDGFAEPIEVNGCAHLGETGVDEWASALLKFPNDIVAELTTGVRLSLPDGNSLKIYGTEGYLNVYNPWTPSRHNRDPVRMMLHQYAEEEPREIAVEAPKDLYTYEVDVVAEHIPDRQAPEMSWDDTLGNIRVLDMWREEIGLTYECEKI